MACSKDRKNRYCSFATMDSKRAQTVAALAESFFPSLEEDARAAHSAGKDNLAQFLSTSGGSLKFVVSEVCSRKPMGSTTVLRRTNT